MEGLVPGDEVSNGVLGELTAMERGHSPLSCLQTAIPLAESLLAVPLHSASITYRVATKAKLLRPKRIF
jgi:hypothetical protein